MKRMRSWSIIGAVAVVATVLVVVGTASAEPPASPSRGNLGVSAAPTAPGAEITAPEASAAGGGPAKDYLNPLPGEVWASGVEGWFESINGPIQHPLLGKATVTPATWAAGDVVSVTGQVLYPFSECSGQYVDGQPRSRRVGTTYVRISLSGATTLAHGPTSLPGATIYPFDGGVQWITDQSNPFGPGTFTSTFRAAAPSSEVSPFMQITSSRLQDDACIAVQQLGLITLRGAARPAGIGTSSEPTADFAATVSADDRFEYAFENRSRDPEDGLAGLTSVWDFGDGSTSTETDPTHRYDHAGSYDVTLTVTDTTEKSAVTSRTLTIAGALVVNSTGDGAAADPEDQGCDTGDTGDGGEPECTLRAAIETADQQGGGDITFAIAGSGIPTIAAASPLPALTSSSSIDGTSQDGGWVRVEGAGAGTLVLDGGTSTITGLSIGASGDGGAALQIAGGSGHTIRGNRLGTDAEGTVADGTVIGLVVDGAEDVLIQDNVVGADGGIYVGAGAEGIDVLDNRVGVTSSGTAALGDPEVAILAAAPSATIRGNTVRGSTVGIEVLGVAAGGTVIDDNAVGVSSDGAVALGGTGYGIRVDGTPDVAITNNAVVGDSYGAILVAGSAQASRQGDGSLLLAAPTDVTDKPVTGGRATITGNRVGIAGGVAVPDVADRGIVSWAGAGSLSIRSNLVVGTSSAAIELTGGAEHRIAGNTLGSAAAPVGTGVVLDGTAQAVVGGDAASGNTTTSTTAGVEVRNATGTRLAANRTTAAAGATDHVGIGVAADGGATVIVDNVLAGGATGIASLDAETVASRNTIVDQAVAGIRLAGDRSSASSNVVTGGGGGIVVGGDRTTVTDNRVGLAAGSETVTPSTGTGVTVTAGRATVASNSIAGSASGGIAVAATATADLHANRIRSVTGLPIDAPGGPEAPQLVAAIRTGSGATLRRTLLLQGLPAGDAGTIEVFAGDTCTDPEPRVVLGISRTKQADEQRRIIQVVGNATRDHFTVTYTTADGSTSSLSACQDGTDFPDGDDDGSVDPLDEFAGASGDPTQAVVASDSEQLLLLAVTPYDAATDAGGGTLEAVAIGDDPAPGTHPAGWSLPYGALSFRIADVEPGRHTSVVLATLTGDSPIGGTSYWKHGPITPGAAPGWYSFAYDATSDTGATLSNGVSIGGELRRAWVLRLVDGGRGDSDGGANGTITDPGGPVVGGDAGTEVPVDPPPVDPTPIDSSAPPPLAPPAAPAGPGQVAAGPLPRTGASPAPMALAGLCLVAVGIGLLAGRRRTRSVARP